MPNPEDVTGVIVKPEAVASDRRAEITGPKDTTVIVKSPETIDAERLARAAQVEAAQLRTASQRYVNLIWEYTQATIAVLVVLACIIAAFILDPSRSEILRNAFFLIVGFYFGRTNHQNQGGTGPMDPLQQSGR